ncbi:hypothetical protein PMAYCL1PPCAC_32269 [Pristionchus mayeri]|uniref:Uncharacterized protein n=1 Tax=Pristionchus mayeri TaxID=1317129 RepID=A0AAN5DF77_9BILA|nr:hypothetical protein PMAYCL1PPCAC_32269 [Pristionchus mayeri]
MDTTPSSISQHIINANESDYLIECVNKYSSIIVDLATNRSVEANGARTVTWARITEMFNTKFNVEVTTKALKSNLSYRQGKLKRIPSKYTVFREWLKNPTRSERDMEMELGRGDFLLLKLFGEEVEKPLMKRAFDDLETSMKPNEWNGNEAEASPYHFEPSFMDAVPKDEFDPDSFSEDSRPPVEPLPAKRARVSPQVPPPQPLPPAPSPIRVDRVVDEESQLRMELLRAQIELTKTQQIAAEKQIQANTAMILMMDNLTKRIEKKSEESDQSSVSSLISIMKEMVKK